jgi:hypothetical protein
MVFVFATVTMVNANSNVEKNRLMTLKISCAELAANTQAGLEENGVPMETANEAASLIYDLCMIEQE